MNLTRDELLAAARAAARYPEGRASRFLAGLPESANPHVTAHLLAAEPSLVGDG